MLGPAFHAVALAPAIAFFVKIVERLPRFAIWAITKSKGRHSIRNARLTPAVFGARAPPLFGPLYLRYACGTPKLQAILSATVHMELIATFFNLASTALLDLNSLNS